MTTLWAAFAGALAAAALAGVTVAMLLKVRRYNRNLAELRKIADRFSMPSPWWKRWYQPREEWDRGWS